MGIHNCLKNGETPIAGPLADGDDDEKGQQEDAPPASVNPPSAPPSAPAPAPIPAVAPAMSNMSISTPTSGATAALSYDKVAKAQKLCKYAISALDYQDTKTAVEN